MVKQSSFTKLSKDNETHGRGSQWISKKRTRIDFADSVAPGRESNSIYSPCSRARRICSDDTIVDDELNIIKLYGKQATEPSQIMTVI